MKVLLTILGFVNGSYMLLDGIFVTVNGKFMGPDKPGPWAKLFYKLTIDVFKLGPLFVGFGLLWLAWLYALWTLQSWSYAYGLVLALLTLWYLPIGTLFSLTIIGVLVFVKQQIEL